MLRRISSICPSKDDGKIIIIKFVLTRTEVRCIEVKKVRKRRMRKRNKTREKEGDGKKRAVWEREGGGRGEWEREGENGGWNVVRRLRNDAVAAHYRKRQPPLEFMKLQFRPPRCTTSEQFVSQRTEVKIIQSHLSFSPSFFLALRCGIVRCNCRDSNHVQRYRFSPRAAIIREDNNDFHCTWNISARVLRNIEFNSKNVILKAI